MKEVHCCIAMDPVSVQIAAVDTHSTLSNFVFISQYLHLNVQELHGVLTLQHLSNATSHHCSTAECNSAFTKDTDRVSWSVLECLEDDTFLHHLFNACALDACSAFSHNFCG